MSVNFFSPLPSTFAIHNDTVSFVQLVINATAFDFTTLAVGYGMVVGIGVKVGYIIAVNVGTGVSVDVSVGNCVAMGTGVEDAITGVVVACAQEDRRIEKITKTRMVVRTTRLYFVFIENFLSSLVE
jgi:hypothetical protein